MHCPTCRAELLHQPLSTLACPGCGRGYWQRGGELVPEGEHDAIEVPSTQLPRARVRPKK
jgi:Zn-finger nucleic acid-binding protein